MQLQAVYFTVVSG